MLNTHFRMKPDGGWWCPWPPPFSCVTIEPLLGVLGRTGFSPSVFSAAQQDQNRQAEARPTQILLVRRFLVFLPFFKIRFGHHREHAMHAVVPQAAELRAYDFIIAGIVCGEV